jgi:hypothetical protein
VRSIDWGFVKLNFASASERATVGHNTPKGLLKGSKFNGKHTTVIEAAIGVVKAANESPYVSKIVIGIITPTKTGKPHIKFNPRLKDAGSRKYRSADFFCIHRPPR